jgi:hypothetical protein
MGNTSDVFGFSLGVVLACGLLFLLFLSIQMIAKDARKRGKPGLLIALLVLFTFPMGLLLWLLFRPEPRDPDSQPFRLSDHRIQ